jgi:hypothetical protein
MNINYIYFVSFVQYFVILCGYGLLKQPQTPSIFGEGQGWGH